MNILTIIPIACSQIVNKDVLISFFNQSIQSGLQIVTNDRCFVGMEDMPKRLNNCVYARNLCLDLMKKYLEFDTFDAFVMLDSDCIIQDSISIELMYKFLQTNKDFVGVALNKAPTGYTVGLEDSHIPQGCIMLTREFFDLDIKFRYVLGGVCECSNFTQDIRSKGKRYGYLDNKKRLIDLHSDSTKTTRNI